MGAPSIRAEVDNVLLKPGETITLWLQINEPNGNYKACQVEVRITKDYKPQIFHADGIEILHFDNWHKDEK